MQLLLEKPSFFLALLKLFMVADFSSGGRASGGFDAAVVVGSCYDGFPTADVRALHHNTGAGRCWRWLGRGDQGFAALGLLLD